MCTVCTDKKTKHAHPFRRNRYWEGGKQKGRATKAGWRDAFVGLMWSSLSGSLGQFGTFSGFYLSLTDADIDVFAAASCLPARNGASERLPAAAGEKPALPQIFRASLFPKFMCLTFTRRHANARPEAPECSGAAQEQTIIELTVF